jgi:hypothetical protein
MTGQIHDMVLHNRSIYSLCGIRGNGLFDPADHGLQPSEMSAACQRGYHCLYSVEDGVLLLQHVKVGHDLGRKREPGTTRPTKIFGVLPAEGDHLGTAYNALNHPIPFTGSLLLGRDFIAELYQHVGFQSPHNCREVIELTFDDGTVVDTVDRSDEMREIRRQQAREEKARRRLLLQCTEERKPPRPAAGVFSIEY